MFRSKSISVHRLQGKTAVVTGASSGIGREFARQLAGLKMNVVLIARREHKLQELADELGEQKVKIVILPLDLTERTQCQSVKRVFETEDIALLVNCAGNGVGGSFSGGDLDSSTHAVYLNSIVPMELMYYAIQHFQKQQFGAVINISSILAFKSLEHDAVYAASKAFLKELSLGLAQEYAESNIFICTVCPGDVRTEMLALDYGMPLEKIPSSILVMEPEECVQITLREFSRGKHLIIPGRLNQLFSLLLLALPRSWISFLEKRLFSEKQGTYASENS